MRLRVYVDTSVVGGCLDAEFAEESRALIEMARRGEVVLLVSDLLLQELARAPREVQEVLTAVPREYTEEVAPSDEGKRLRDAYVAGGVVPEGSKDDAYHVALATLSRADVVVSWNFKHIVHFDKVRGFNAVNAREGYPVIDIRSPRELV